MWMGYRIAAAVAATLNLILALITGGHHPGLVNYLQRFLRFEARMSMSVLRIQLSPAQIHRAEEGPIVDPKL
jgi:hypothetical protein